MARNEDHPGDRLCGSKREEPAVLQRLSADELLVTLQTLLGRHPELEDEARDIAKGLAAEVSPDAIAEEVERSVLSLGYEELNVRAGRHEWGYVEPAEAAWELLEESIAEYVQEIQRRCGLGLGVAAEHVCRGVVLGLYALRDSRSGDVLGWAPDFPAEGACLVLEALMEATPEGDRREAHDRTKAFLQKQAEEWADLPLRGDGR